MLSRRSFVLSSFALASLANAQVRAQGPRDKARLILHFTGGTAFKRQDGKLIAAQLSGRYLNGQPYYHPVTGEPMLHRSYIVLPAKPTGLTPFPNNYQTTKLNGRIHPPSEWAPYCLAGRDVRVSATDGAPFEYKCTKVAHYGDGSFNPWTPLGDWMDTTRPFGENISSRFSIANGVLDDGKPHNEEAKDRYWRIGKSSWRTLSDVATLTVDARDITLDIAGFKPIAISTGTTFEAFVFAGPERHSHLKEYHYVYHNLLLHTIFQIPDGDVRPFTDKAVKSSSGSGKTQVHPCDLKAGTDYDRSPPDSDYCVNYDEFP
jgi:hypothetical protein